MEKHKIELREVFEEKVAKEVFGTHDITLANGEIIKSWIHHLSRLSLVDNPQEYLENYLQNKLTN